MYLWNEISSIIRNMAWESDVLGLYIMAYFFSSKITKKRHEKWWFSDLNRKKIIKYPLLSVCKRLIIRLITALLTLYHWRKGAILWAFQTKALLDDSSPLLFHVLSFWASQEQDTLMIRRTNALNNDHICHPLKARNLWALHGPLHQWQCSLVLSPCRWYHVCVNDE